MRASSSGTAKTPTDGEGGGLLLGPLDTGDWRTCMRAPACLVLGLLLASSLTAGLAQVSHAEIFRWTDSQGRPHFSDRPEDVPPAARHALGLDRPPAAAKSRPSKDAGGQGFELPLLPGIAGDEAPASGPQPNAKTPEAARARKAIRALEGPALAVAIAAGLVVLGLFVAFGALALLTGCRVVRRESPGFRRAYGIVIVQMLAALVVEPSLVVAAGQSETGNLSGLLHFQGFSLLGLWVAHAAVLRGMLCEGIGQALGLALVVDLVTFGLGVVLVLGVLFCAGGAAVLG